MSRIYHNEALSSLPVNTHHVDFELDKSYSGRGLILEGVIVKRSRHVLVDCKQNKERYFVLHLRVTKSHQRKFDANGREIEPNFSETGKVRQGYLHSSYKSAAKGDSDQLTAEETRAALCHAALDRVIATHAPPGGSTVALWVREAQLEKVELADSDNVRIKTSADCPLIDTLAKLDAVSSSVSNYAGGEAVGGSWTDKVMAVKGADAQRLPQDEVEGVDEDEWDD